MTVGLLFVNPNRNVGRLPLVVRICFPGLIHLQGLFQRLAIFLRNAVQRYGCVGLMGVRDVADPADDQLFYGGFERPDAAGHGTVSRADRQGPLGGYVGVSSFRKRDGFSLGLDGEAIYESGFGRWSLRGARDVPLRCSVRKRRHDRKIVTYVEHTAREFDALGGEIGLLLEDVFADVLEGDLGREVVVREAIHDGGGGKR